MLNRLAAPAVMIAAVVLAGCAAGGGGRTYAHEPDPIAQEAAFLEKNSRTKGVVSLPGLQYMVIQSGPAEGPHPKRSDDITVRYEGRFLNGQVFNASPGNGSQPVTFPLEKLIPGWGVALQMMRPGDIWVLYVPSNLAYGATGKNSIPPYATLVFRVELIAVAPHAEPVPPPPPPPPPAAVTVAPLPPPPPPPPPAVAEKPKPKPVVHRRKRPKPVEDGADGTSSTADSGTAAKSMFAGSER